MRSQSHRSWWIVAAVCVALSLVAFAAVGCGEDEGSDTTATSETTATSAATGGGTSGDPVIIGFAAGMTGDAAAGDVPALQGMEYTVKILNESGGIAGRPVELIVKDMKSDVALGATVANQLIDEGAQILVGPAFPGYAAGIIQSAAAAGLTVLGGTSTQPEYTKIGGAKAYLVAFGDNVQAAATAENALAQGYKTVYTLVSPDLSYTAMLPVFFKDVFEKGGGKEIGTDNFTIGQPDFSAQVTKIAGLATQPDCIYVPMFPPDVTTFLTQLRAAGVTAAVFGPDGFDMQAMLDLAGPDAEGVIFSTHGFPTPGSRVEEWVNGYTEWKGQAPESSALGGLGCDCIYVVKAAVEAAGSLDPKAIGDALATLENVQVVTGVLTYKGTDGVPLKTVTIATVKDGKFAFVEERIPEYVPPAQ